MSEITLEEKVKKLEEKIKQLESRVSILEQKINLGKARRQTRSTQRKRQAKLPIEKMKIV